MSDQKPTYDLPLEIVEQLLCSHCNAYVSCGPVKVQPNDGGTICGRCSPSVNEECVRHPLFEAAMSKFTFPCRYKAQGCTKRLLFGAIQHEDVCPYRTFCCPALLRGNCTAKVSSIDVYEHFKKAHMDLIVKNGKFKLEFEQDIQCNILIAAENIIVIGQYNYDSLKGALYFNCRQFPHMGQQNIYFRIQLISGSDPDRALSFKDIACGCYESPNISEQNATKLIMSNYLPALENPGFVYINVLLTVNNKTVLNSDAELSLSDNSCVVSITAQNQVDEHEQAAQLVLQSFSTRCHICRGVALPSYKSDGRYSNDIYCYDCKKFCSYSTSLQSVNGAVPCRWRGCTFMGDINIIQNHVENCKLRTYICPVPVLCPKGYYRLDEFTSHLRHMQQHGAEYCADPENIVVKLFSENAAELVKVYFTVLENTVIAFTCRVWGRYNWNLMSNTTNFNIDVCFEHDHCRYRSPCYSHQRTVNYGLQEHQGIALGLQLKQNLPECFLSCKRISAVIKVKP